MPRSHSFVIQGTGLGALPPAVVSHAIWDPVQLISYKFQLGSLETVLMKEELLSGIGGKQELKRGRRENRLASGEALRRAGAGVNCWKPMQKSEAGRVVKTPCSLAGPHMPGAGLCRLNQEHWLWRLQSREDGRKVKAISLRDFSTGSHSR